MHEVVTKADLTIALDNLTLRLTIRLGCMIAAGVVATAALAVLTS